MKLTHRKITASTAVPEIPAPFDEYYEVISDDQIEEETGLPAHPSPCEECEGYDIEHIAYVTAKPEYQDFFVGNGLDPVELVKEGDRTYLAYVVHSRIYSVDESDLPDDTSWEDYEEAGYLDDIEESTDVEGAIARTSYLGPNAGKRNSSAFYKGYQVICDAANKLWDIFDKAKNLVQGGFESKSEAFDYIRDNLAIAASTDITAAIDTGLDYWYYGRHGLGPGTIPEGVTVLDTVEEGWKTWMLLDKMLTTEELNYYDLKEEWPPEGSVTHNGDVIACDDIQAGTCEKVKETDDSIDYVVSSTDIEEEIMEEVEGMSLVRYGGFRILQNRDDFRWDIMGPNGDYLKTGFPSQQAAKEYIDDTIPVSVNSSEDIQAADEDLYNIDSAEIADMTLELDEARVAFMMEPMQGFDAIEADEYSFLDVEDEGDHVRVEVRAELSYEDMDRFADYLNPIIKKYDPNAYFEQETFGIMSAFVYLSNDLNASEEVEGQTIEAASELPEREINPPYEDDEFIPKDDVVIDLEFDHEPIKIEEGGEWDFVDDALPVIEDAIMDTGEDLDPEDVLEDVVFLILWHVPSDPGTYEISCKLHLVYDMDNANGPTMRLHKSGADDFDWEKVSDIVESKTDVQAAMTEEELDDAILNDKPFDLNDFKKYKSQGLAPDVLTADALEIGDVVSVDEDASEVNLGTVVKILSINDPAADWIDYTFKVELISDPDPAGTVLEEGDIIYLHFDGDEPVGRLVTE